MTHRFTAVNPRKAPKLMKEVAISSVRFKPNSPITAVNSRLNTGALVFGLSVPKNGLGSMSARPMK
ncbi:hypothetical protein D3C80_1391990 [compost metagenome]